MILTFFRKICSKSSPAWIWKLPTNRNEISLCIFFADLCTNMHCIASEQLHTCLLCNLIFVDVFCLSSCVCSSTLELRNTITHSFDLCICAELCRLSEHDLYMTLLHCNTSTHLDNTEYAFLYRNNFHLIRACAAHYNRTHLYHTGKIGCNQ